LGLKVNRTALGRVVRQAWIDSAKDHPQATEAWLLSYDDLSPENQELCNRAGEAVANYLQLEAGVRYSVVPSDPNVKALGMPWTVSLINPRENQAAFRQEGEALAYCRHLNGQDPIETKSLGKTTAEKAVGVVQTMSQSAGVEVVKSAGGGPNPQNVEKTLSEKVAEAQAAAKP
jgi:hypothetical protein